MARLRVYGRLPIHAAIVVGSWDPLLPINERCLAKLARRFNNAESKRGALVPVLLDPSPAFVLNGNRCPRFECAEARVARLLKRGIGGVIQLSLAKRDCTRGIEWFLEALSAYVRVRTLLLHPFQSLGSAELGDRMTVERICRSKKILILDSGIRRSPHRMHLYNLYAKKAFHEIAFFLERPLAWKVTLGPLRVPLPQGLYRVRVGTRLESLVDSDCHVRILRISSKGNATLTSPIANSSWLGVLRRVGKG